MTYIGDRHFLLEVSKGNVPGHSLVEKFGKNDSVPNGSWALVSDLASSFLQATTKLRVKAGNAADTAAGAGAQSILVEGIDSTLAYVSETLVPNGASPGTAGTLDWWRPVRAYVTACGTYGAANTAAVVIENSAGTADLLKINTEEGQTQFASFTVPTGVTAYLVEVILTVDALKPADIRLMTRENFNDVTTPYSPVRIKRYWTGIESRLVVTFEAPLKFEALTDVWFEANGAGAATAVSVEFEMVLVDD